MGVKGVKEDSEKNDDGGGVGGEKERRGIPSPPSFGGFFSDRSDDAEGGGQERVGPTAFAFFSPFQGSPIVGPTHRVFALVSPPRRWGSGEKKRLAVEGGGEEEEEGIPFGSQGEPSAHPKGKKG